MRVDQVLATCAEHVRRERELRHLIGQLLVAAAAAGVSWRQIARRVGLPVMTAHGRARRHLTSGDPHDD